MKINNTAWDNLLQSLITKCNILMNGISKWEAKAPDILKVKQLIYSNYVRRIVKLQHLNEYEVYVSNWFQDRLQDTALLSVVKHYEGDSRVW